MANIVIVGITGVGKTTIGRLLADNLDKEFIDLDKAIETRCGVDISTIFEIEGESKFRQRESFELSQVITNKDNYVLSLGGGCVMSEDNRNLIVAANCSVIQLGADTNTLVERLSKSIGKRPLFNNVDISVKVSDLYKSRKEFYDKITDLYLDTSGMHASEVVDKLLICLSSYSAKLSK